MIRLLILALLTLLVSIPSVQADNCRQAVVVQQKAHHDYAYVAPATAYAPFLLLQQPSYYVGLSYPDAAKDLEYRELRLEIEKMRFQMERLTLPMQGQGQSQGQQALPLTASLTSAKCASCHSGGKGAGPKIDFTALSPELKALSIERVLNGSMPPKSRLSKEERRQVNAEILK